MDSIEKLVNKSYFLHPILDTSQSQIQSQNKGGSYPRFRPVSLPVVSPSFSEAEWSCLHGSKENENYPENPTLAISLSRQNSNSFSMFNADSNSNSDFDSRPHQWNPSWIISPVKSAASQLANFLWSPFGSENSQAAHSSSNSKTLPGETGKTIEHQNHQLTNTKSTEFDNSFGANPHRNLHYDHLEISRFHIPASATTTVPNSNLNPSLMSAIGRKGGDGNFKSVLSHLTKAIAVENRNEKENDTNNFNSSQGSVCNRSFDGLLCWPQTTEGFNVTLPCFKNFRGISYEEAGTVTRLCLKGGIWQNETIDYSQCIPKPHAALESWALEVTHDIYFAGYCLSLVALIISLSIFFGFKELKCLRNKIHMHLMVTYILADLLWVITSVQYHLGNHTASCVTFILLHYFHLTNFFWMFVEGLYLYILVVKTFTQETVKQRGCLIIGWGLPLLVVIVWTVVKWLNHPIPVPVSIPGSVEVQKGDFDQELSNCFWLNVSVYDWIYKVPAIFVLISNSVFLLRIMWVLITKLRSATNPETQQSRKAAKAMVILIPLFGITYVLILRGSSSNVVYEIIRAVLISTQGFVVSLLYCFLMGEVRIALRRGCNSFREIIDPSFKYCCCYICLGGGDGRSGTESIRLYTPSQTMTSYRKRGSSASETTTVTTCVGPSSASAAIGIPGPSKSQTQAQTTVTVNTSPNHSRKSSTTTTTKTYNSTDSANLL